MKKINSDLYKLELNNPTNFSKPRHFVCVSEYDLCNLNVVQITTTNTESANWENTTQEQKTEKPKNETLKQLIM